MNTRDKDPRRIKKKPAEQGKPKHPGRGRTKAKRTEARKRAKQRAD